MPASKTDAKAVTARKQWPEAYPEDVARVLRAMSLNGTGTRLTIAGSASLRSAAYPADVDAIEAVPEKGAGRATPKAFADVIRRLLRLQDVFIADIKAGVVAKWAVFSAETTVQNGKVVGYNREAARAKVEQLRDEKVISKEEADEALTLLVPDKQMTPLKLLNVLDVCRWHVLRWRPADILRGQLVARDGTRIALSEALQDADSLAKLDTIALVGKQRYKEFSVIYDRGGKAGAAAGPKAVADSLRLDILRFSLDGKPYKAIKRIFALARMRDDSSVILRAVPLLNGDLGLLNSLISDCDALLYLCEQKADVPEERIKYELDQFRGRLSHIYQIPRLVEEEKTLLGALQRIDRLPSQRLCKAIAAFRDVLDGLLNVEAERAGKEAGLLPPPPGYR